MARLYYPRVLLQLLWRMRWDLLLMVGLCLAMALPGLVVQRDLITLPQVEATLGIAVSVFLGFRNTQAINRWWEARSLWGLLVNQSRSWRDAVLVLLEPSGAQGRAQRRLLQLQVVSIWLLNFELRNFASAGLRRRVLAMVAELGLAPALTLQQLARVRTAEIQRLSAQGCLTQLGRDALIRSLVVFNDGVGGLQKIRNTPLPLAYDAFVRLIAWLFGFELYLDCLVADEPLLGAALFMGSLTAERIGAYVEAPFDRDPGSLSLPIDQICLGISDDLLADANPFADIPSCRDPSIWT